MIELRPYQTASIQALRGGLRDGHRRQVLVAPTGAGKTVCASHLLSEVQAKGTKACFIVDRVALCAQTSAMLWSYGVTHGVAQSDNTFGRHEPIQVCSAQTIEKRGFFPDLDVLIIDECHTQRKVITEFAKVTKAAVIGLTATPFSKGMGEVYSNVVNVTTTNELIAAGWLAPLKVYAAKEIDMIGAKVIAGEWSDREVEDRGRAIIGDIVAEWQDKTQKHFGGPVKTIAFSATVDHGEEICRQFQAAGYNFQQVSYRDGNDERRAKLIEEFRKPDSSIVGLVSCEALAKGFDVPDILCGIGAQPYRKSFSSHIQMIGRAMRSAPGKQFALWLDHCLASGSRVLTDSGLVPIEQVTLEHRLWDGHTWVQHGGVVNAGMQECITYAGLTATREHRVKTRRGWMAFGQAAEEQESIVTTGLHRQAVFERDGCFSGGCVVGADIEKTQRQVWDIRDAGPRNCFTCEGLLTHNSGNYLGFMSEMEDLFQNGVSRLDNGEREKTVRKEGEKQVSDIVCSCGYVMKPSMDRCPACGKVRQRKSRVIEVPGEMVEVNGKPLKPYLQDAESAWRQICAVALERKQGDIMAAEKFALAQFKNFYGRWPRSQFEANDQVDPRLRSHITANVIRYAKARKTA